MAPPGWANPQQTALLSGLIPEYESCQVSRQYKPFWKKLYSIYLNEYPLIATLFPGLTVQSLDSEQMTKYQKALGALQNRLREWFRWRCNARSRKVAVTVPAKVLKSIYTPRTRGPKAYEAFAKLNPVLVSEVHEARCEEQSLGGKRKIGAWHAVCKELYSRATEEQLKAVDEHVEKYTNEKEDDNDPTPKDRQRYISYLPAILKSVVEPPVRKAGLMAIITLVGPVSDASGKISAWTLQFGDKDDTPLFSSSWVDHDRVYVEAVARFAKRHVFNSEVPAEHSKEVPAEHSEDGVMEEKSPETQGTESPVNSDLSPRRPDETDPNPNSVAPTLSGGPPSSPNELRDGSHSRETSPPPDSPALRLSTPRKIPSMSPLPTWPNYYGWDSTLQNGFGNGLGGLSNLSSGNLLDNFDLDLEGDLLRMTPGSMPSSPSPSGSFQSLGPSATAAPSHNQFAVDNDVASFNKAMFETPAATYNDLLPRMHGLTNYGLLGPRPVEPKASSSGYTPSVPANPDWATLNATFFGTSALHSDRDIHPPAQSGLLVPPGYVAPRRSPLNPEVDLLTSSSSFLRNVTLTSASGSSNESTSTAGLASSSSSAGFSQPSLCSNLVVPRPSDTAPSVPPPPVPPRPVRLYPARPSYAPPPGGPLHALRGGEELYLSPAVPVKGPTVASDAAEAPLPRTPSSDLVVPRPSDTAPSVPPPPVPPRPVRLYPARPSYAPPPGGPLHALHGGEESYLSPAVPVKGPTVASSAAEAPLPQHSPSSNQIVTPDHNLGASSLQHDTSSLSQPGTVPTPSIPQPKPLGVPNRPPQANPVQPGDIPMPSPEPDAPNPASVPSVTAAGASVVPANPLPQEKATNLPKKTTNADAAPINPRRSLRGSVPSKERESLQQIGTNRSTVSKVAPSKAAPLTCPDWFSSAMADIQDDGLGAEWVSLVGKWATLERTLGYGRVAKGSMPVKERPEEWSKWTSKGAHGARNHSRAPFIDDPAEFGIAITKWWKSIQPAFRISDDTSLPLPIYEDESAETDFWAPLRRSGPNGTLSLIMLMLWWGRAAAPGPEPFREDSRDSWKALLDDISHTFDAFIFTAPYYPENLKRGAEENDPAGAPPQSEQGLVFEACLKPNALPFAIPPLCYI